MEPAWRGLVEAALDTYLNKRPPRRRTTRPDLTLNAERGRQTV